MKEIENREEPDNKDNQINYTANKLILGSSVNPKLPAVWSLLDRWVGFKFSILLMLQFTFGMLGASQVIFY